MPEYVALLRGIGPANPNQRNDKLRGVFEEFGFEDVRTVSSGNVLFRSDSTDTVWKPWCGSSGSGRLMSRMRSGRTASSPTRTQHASFATALPIERLVERFGLDE